MIGDLGTDSGNTTMVGGAGFDTMIGSNGSDVMFVDDSTPQAQAYWTQADRTALTDFSVQLVQPSSPLAGITTIPELLQALTQYQKLEVQLFDQVEQLGSLETPFLNANEPVPPSLSAQFANVDDDYLETLSSLTIIATRLYPPACAGRAGRCQFHRRGLGHRRDLRKCCPAAGNTGATGRRPERHDHVLR